MKTIDKKYELTDEVRWHHGRKLFRIRALRDFGDVKAGDLGGFIEKEKNLSHEGTAWVYGNAIVEDNARVAHDALVKNDAWVGDNAVVKNDAWVCGNAVVKNDAWVCGSAIVSRNAIVGGCAKVCRDAAIGNKALVNSEEDYVVVSGFGSRHRTTTFFRLQSGGVGVSCGCFSGTIEEFRTKVHETHKGTKYEKEYLAIADAIEIHFAR